MPRFFYTAVEARTGRDRQGTIESASAEQAAFELKSRGLAPTSLQLDGAITRTHLEPAKTRSRRTTAAAAASASGTAKPRAIRWQIGRTVSLKALTIFTRQLATLIKAGLPLLRCLEVLARQERDAGFRAVLESVGETIRSGGNFSDGLQQHPKIFDRLYVNMVKAGEAGGVLATVLERIARFMEKAEQIKGKVKSAMTYPLIVITLAVGIVSALMVFVVPKFEQIFAGLLKGQPLPLLTQWVLGLSYFVTNHIVATLCIGVGLLVAFQLVRRTKRGARGWDWLLFHAPITGDLYLKASIARFTRTFGTLLASGVPILHALLITRDTCGNIHLADALDLVHDRVKEGDNVAAPLQATGVFPAMVTSMIEVGEETGALPDMLTRIADSYDEEVDNAVAALTSIIEPLMIVFLALLVGTIVIALFLPIVSIIQYLQ